MTNPSDELLIRRISALLDGELSDEEELALAQTLRSDPHARRVYLDLVAVHVGLSWQGNEHQFSSPQSAPALPSQTRTRFRIREATVLLATLLSLLVGVVIWYVSRSEKVKPVVVETAPAPAAREQADLSLMVAMVWGETTARTANHRLNLQAGATVPGGPLELTEGSVRLAMLDGAVLTFLAPCQADLISSRHVAIHRGTVLVDLPHDQAQLELTTPVGEIRHHGTVFAVNVEPTGTTQVEVEEGFVAIDSPFPTDQGVTAARLFSKGEASQIDTNGYQTELDGTAPLSSRFERWDRDRIFRPRPLSLLAPGLKARFVRAQPGNPIHTLERAAALLEGAIPVAEETTVEGVEFVDFQDASYNRQFPTGQPFANVFQEDQPFPGDAGGLEDNDDDFVLHLHGTLVVQDTWQYSFLTTVDDGVQLRIDGRDVIIDKGRHPPTISIATLTLEEGHHDFDLIYYERSSYSRLELGAAPGATTVVADFELLRTPTEDAAGN